jgi:hypothetical protein
MAPCPYRRATRLAFFAARFVVLFAAPTLTFRFTALTTFFFVAFFFAVVTTSATLAFRLRLPNRRVGLLHLALPRHVMARSAKPANVRFLRGSRPVLKLSPSEASSEQLPLGSARAGAAVRISLCYFAASVSSNSLAMRPSPRVDSQEPCAMSADHAIVHSPVRTANRVCGPHVHIEINRIMSQA